MTTYEQIIAPYTAFIRAQNWAQHDGRRTAAVALIQRAARDVVAARAAYPNKTNWVNKLPLESATLAGVFFTQCRTGVESQYLINMSRNCTDRELRMTANALRSTAMEAGTECDSMTIDELIAHIDNEMYFA